MKNRLSFLPIFFLLLGFCFSNCTKDEPAPPAPVVRTYQDVINDFNEIDISKGIRDESLEFQTGIFWDFRVIAPDVQSGVKYPLLIDLHGASGGNPDAHRNSECYMETGLDGKDFFVIIPNAGNLLWDHLSNQAKVLELTRLARSNWPVDTTKVAVSGYSNGGNGSWFLGETQSEVFSAAIPMASSYNVLGTDGNVREITTPMYVIHGDNDELFPIDSTRKWVNLANANGSNIEFTAASALGHYQPCEYGLYFKDAIVWLEETVWK